LELLKPLWNACLKAEEEKIGTAIFIGITSAKESQPQNEEIRGLAI